MHSVSSEAHRAVDRENPWPGLAAFEEGDEDFFKGREGEASAMLRLILRQDLTMLWGLSGLGKTSLLRAGLFPRLRAMDVFPVYVRLRYADDSDDPDLVPSFLEQCLQAIREAADRWRYEIPANDVGATSLWEYTRRRGQRFWGPGDRLATPLLVFDQFEEIFAKSRSDKAWAEIERFFRDVGDTITGAAPDWLLERQPALDEAHDAASDKASDEFLFKPGVLKVMLSFREDYLGRIAALTPLVRGIDHSSYRLQAMTVSQALDVVAKAGGHLLEGSPEQKADLCERIVARVSDAPTSTAETDATVDPGLLSLFCRELNEKRRAQRKAAIDAELVASSEASQIIADFYESCMKRVSPATRQFVENRLVLRESRSRDSVAKEIATADGATEDDLAILIGKRILRPDETTRGGRSIVRLELTHDVLIEPALMGRARRELVEQRVREERERRQAAEREKEAAEREKEAAEQQRAAAEQAAREAAREQRLERAALKAQAKTRKRNRLLLAAAGVIAVLAVLLVSFNRQSEAARQRLIRETAERAVEDSVSGRTAESLGRLASVLRQQPDNEAARSLTLDLLLRRPWLVPVALMRPAEGAFERMEFNTRGNMIAAVTSDGSVELLETDTGRKIVAPLPAGTGDLHVAFSPDDRWLVTGTDAGAVGVWDAATGSSIVRIQPASRIRALAVYSGPGETVDDLTVATWSDDRFIRIWIVSGSVARESARFDAGVPDGGPDGIEVSPDGRRLLTRSVSAVTVWDLTRNRQLWSSAQPLLVTHSRFDPAGEWVLIATADGRLSVWDPDARRLLARFQPGRLGGVGFDQDGSRLWTVRAATEDASQPQAAIWQLRQTTDQGSALPYTLDRVAVVRSAEAYAAAAFADDPVLVTRSVTGNVRLADVRSGAPLGAPLLIDARAMRLTRGGRRLAVLDGSGSVRVLIVRPPAPPTDLPSYGRLRSAQFARDGQHVLTGSGDGAARVWDLGARYPLQEFLHPEAVLSVDYNADQTQVLTLTEQAFRLWKADTAEPLWVSPSPGGRFVTARLNSTATQVVTASDPGFAAIWDVSSGHRVLDLSEARNVRYAEFSPSGDRVVTASRDGTADVWDARTGARVGRPFDHSGADVISARFSDDGARVVTIIREELSVNLARMMYGPTNQAFAVSDRTAMVWAVDGRTPPVRLTHLGMVSSAQFGTSATRVITTSHDWTARIWTLAGTSPSVVTLAHDAPVDGAELDATRRRLVTVSSAARDIRIWDAETGAAISRTLTVPSVVWSARFSPDGQRIVAATEQGAQIFDVPSAARDDAGWLADLAEAVGGLQMDAGGAMQATGERGARLAALRGEATATDAPADFKRRFLRRFFLDNLSDR